MKNWFARLGIQIFSGKSNTYSSSGHSIVLIPGVIFMAFYLEFLEITGHKQCITIDLKDQFIKNSMSSI